MSTFETHVKENKKASSFKIEKVGTQHSKLLAL
jgi:hypothetical protein